LLSSLGPPAARAACRTGRIRAGLAGSTVCQSESHMPGPVACGRGEPWGLVVLFCFHASTRPWEQGAGHGLLLRIESAVQTQAAQFPAGRPWP